MTTTVQPATDFTFARTLSRLLWQRGLDAGDLAGLVRCPERRARAWLRGESEPSKWVQRLVVERVMSVPMTGLDAVRRIK